MRNDSLLYTGGSSSSPSERRAEAIKKRLDDKKNQQQTLAPSADLVFETLDKNVKKLQLKMLSLVGPGTPESDVKALLVALNMHADLVKETKTELQNILRAEARK